jgi:hypothetical protein
MDFDEAEREELYSKFPIALIDKINKDYNDMTDYQSLQLILSYKSKYYPTQEAKDKLLDLMRLQCSADGVFDGIEQEVYHFLEKLM